MIMKKCLFLSLLFLTNGLSVLAQDEHVSQKIERYENFLYVVENDIKYHVDTHKIVIKPKDPQKGLLAEMKVLHSNKLGYITIQIPDGIDIIKYVEQLKSTGIYKSVEYIPEIKSCLNVNDYYINNILANQWFLNRINLWNTWDITTGDSNIKVAVLDSGVNWNNPDLGYGNDNYTNLDASLEKNYDAIPYDYSVDIHGTMVAGIIGAKTNNNKLVIGVAGGNHSHGATIISYRIYNELSYNGDHLSEAIIDATDDGAKIINCSFHTASTSERLAAIGYAYSHGVAIVCSTGNDNNNSVAFPASDSRTIAVGAIDKNDHRWVDSNSEGSNYGNGIDLVAPGKSICTTGQNNYSIATGTSAATPIVSGTIALMLSVNPYLTHTQIRDIVRKTSNKIPSYGYNNLGWNNEIGYGVLNSFAAVLLAANTQLLGTSIICYGSTATYTISNLPSNASVNWNITNNSNSISLPMTTSGNSCTVANNSSESFIGTVNATISTGGNVLAVLKQDIIVHGSLSAHYYQGNNSGYISNGSNIYVSANSPVYIESPNFRGMNVSWNNSYAQPSNWHYDGDQLVIVTHSGAQYGNNPIVVNVTATQGQPSCNNFTFNIYNSRLKSTLDIRQLGDDLYIFLKPNMSYIENKGKPQENIIDATKWEMAIYNSSTGEKIYYDRTPSGKTISTSGWKSGIYVVQVTIGDEELTEKIVVK